MCTKMPLHIADKFDMLRTSEVASIFFMYEWFLTLMFSFIVNRKPISSLLHPDLLFSFFLFY